MSDLVVGLLDVGAVPPLCQHDGLHMSPVQTVTLWSVSGRLRGGVVVLEGGSYSQFDLLPSFHIVRNQL